MILINFLKLISKKIKVFTVISNDISVLLSMALVMVWATTSSLCGTCTMDEIGVKRGVSENILNLTALHDEAMNGISTENIRENLRYLTNTTHFPGSKENYQLGLTIQERLLEYGFDKVEIKQYNVLISVPGLPGSVTIKDQSGAELYRTSVFEKILDPSENNSQVSPPYNAFSPSGSVTAKLIYAYFGRNKDFEKLKEQGVNISGKIAIIRCGRGNRGNKVYHAAKHGAIGVILYPDPEDFAQDGLDKVFPDYNWLPSTAVPRGSVKKSRGSGDLLTPNFPSVEGIYRQSMASLDDRLPKIPVLSLSYGDAERLLSTLTGELPRFYWKGGLPITYGLQTDTSDNRAVTLTVNTQLVKRDIYNVIGYIRGHEEPDQLVILGNHRDAWVYGGTDPSSGTAAFMEVSRVLGALLKKGWKPRRTIVLASWDAEECGLIGSTEWVEEHAEILKSRAVAYINVDMAIDGNFTFLTRSVPLLDWVVIEAAKKVPSPNGNGSVFDHWVQTSPRPHHKSLPKIKNLKMDSDYATFYNLVGVPVADIRYSYNSLGNGNPLYHTLHDGFRLLDQLIDPTFKYHQATARVMVRVLLSLADSKIIPFNISQYVLDIEGYRDKLLEKLGDTLTENQISVEPLNLAIEKFREAARSFEEVIQKTSESDVQNIRLINSRLMSLEKAFIYAGEHPIIPDSPGKRHVLESPISFSGQRHLAGIYSAVKQARKGKGSWEDVKQQISIVIYSLLSARNLLRLTPI